MTHIAENQNFLYLFMPLLLVATQVFVSKVNTPPTKNEESLAMKVVEYLPLLSGLTALYSPAGLSIYWYTNTILSFV
jgi:membrane protein insertase Oxa1/YidC/SpoIIIJ